MTKYKKIPKSYGSVKIFARKRRYYGIIAEIFFVCAITITQFLLVQNDIGLCHSVIYSHINNID